MSSKNIGTIRGLSNAIPGGLSAGQTSELMKRVIDDLDDVYTQVNSGPLPENDGSALKHINPVNIDSPGDIPALITDQGKIAFLNVANIFSYTQTVKGGGLNITLEDTGNPTNETMVRIKTINHEWRVGMPANATRFSIKDITVGAERLIINSFGAIAIGLPPVGSAIAGEVVLDNNKNISGNNAAGNALLSMIVTDVNDLVALGASFANTGVGHICIPRDTNANLPAAGATRNGIVVLDKTNNRMVYYVSGNRYFMPIGTAF